MNDAIKELVNIISDEYLLKIDKIEKSEESTVGNVYIIYSNNKKIIAKIYDDLNHTRAMINIHNELSNKLYIPNIINNKNNEGYLKISNSKYVVLYSFLDGVQIGKMFNKLPHEVIKSLAIELRKIHNLTKINKYSLDKVPFINSIKLSRQSLLHFDLTKGNIFINENKIGFIDFDDAKYGPAVCDVAILISLLFVSKKRGVDKEGINIFIDTYYKNEENLKFEEIKYIKEIALKWINYTLENNNFNTSTTESFKVKKKMIEDNLYIYDIK